MQARRFRASATWWAWWALAVPGMAALLVHAVVADIPTWLAIIYGLAAVAHVLGAVQLGGWQMVASREGIAVEPGVVGRRKRIAWDDLEAIDLSRPAVKPTRRPPIRLPLSSQQLRDLDAVAAEVTGEPQGHLLRGSTPLVMESVRKSLLVMGGCAVAAIVLVLFLVVPVARMAAPFMGLGHHDVVESLSVVAFLMATVWVLVRARTGRRLAAWFAGVTLLLVILGGAFWASRYRPAAAPLGGDQTDDGVSEQHEARSRVGA